MRRYTIKVDGTEHVMDVEALDNDTFRVHLDDGRVVDVDLEDHQDLAHSVISPDQTKVVGRHPDDPRAGEVRLTAPEVAPPAQAAAQATTRPAVPRPDAPAHAPRGHAAATGGAGVLTAPMPGVVLSVEAPAGTTVARGDVILMLEAMKMNNPLRAPRDGVVAEVMVEAGGTVAFGAPLARIESA